MSIASEISRLQAAKTDIRQAIIDKGVAVPAGDTIDQYPAYISLISGGGGGSSVPRLTSYDSGTKTLSGENFGSTQGTVYMLDRETNLFVAQTVSSWSSTAIVLSSPVSFSYNSTSIYVHLAGGEDTNKIILVNPTLSQDTTVFWMDGSTIRHATTTVSLTGGYNLSGASTYSIGGYTVQRDDIIGVDFGTDYSYFSNSYLLSCFQGLCQPVYVPAGVSYLGGSFMYNCYKYNEPVRIDATSLNDYILMECASLNQPVEIPNVGTISSYFLCNCYSFNQPFSSNATEIYSNFMDNCRSMNSPITLDSVTEVSSNFLYNCQAFNSTLSLESLEDFGQYFMRYCYAFNQPISLPSFNAVYPSDYFMANCTSFNNTIDFPIAVKIPNSFLDGCTSFNQPLTFPLATDIGTNFLDGCFAFNSPISLPSATTIGNRFLYNCYSFNNTISLPAVNEIGEYFLYQCYSFDTDLDVSHATTINGVFMNGCYSFSKTVTLGAATTVYDDFMEYVHSCTVNVGTSTPPGDTYSLSTNDSYGNCYINGINITGTNKAAWRTALPDLSSSPYRKLIVV